MSKTKSVFISSTTKDLASHRAAVKQAIERLEMRPIDMINFGSQPGDASEVSLAQVGRADYFIGIVAKRYGFVPEKATKSVTEQEYDEAIRKRIPRLMYVIDPAFDWPDDAEEKDNTTAKECLENFKTRINKEAVRSFFTTPENLAQQVAIDLARLLRTQRRRELQKLVAIGFLSVIGLALLLIAFVLISDPGIRSNVIEVVGLASRTPTSTPTYTPTATPVPSTTPTTTPTPAPERMPAGFNVVVAGFGLQQEDGSVIQTPVADDIGDLVYSSVKELPEIDHIVGWRDYGVQHLLASDSKDREEQAAQLAEILGADVVIYGIVRQEGMFNILEPEFYITAEFASLEPELVGADTLGSPVEFLEDAPESGPVGALQDRLFVLEHFLRGLSFYIMGDFTAARQAFETAAGAENTGLEVLYIFAGNAAIRETQPEVALELYNTALEKRPDYSRALIGRGIVLYQQALQTAGDNPPPFDPDLTLPPKTYCRDVNKPLPAEPQLLADLALLCYREAELSTDKPETADIDVKAAFGQAQVYVWLSMNNYGDRWDEAERYLTRVIKLYEESEPGRQTRIRATAAHAHAWLGLRLLVTDGSNPEAVRHAVVYYNTALDLLKSDVNRTYNQTWVETYQQQVDALEGWLAKR